jgi:ribosome-associated toxin RatA of RatAB toxin-antitoxin module
MRVAISALLLLSFLSLPPSAEAKKRASVRERLSAGEILLKTRDIVGSDLPEVIVTAVVEAPPAQVWRIIEDCSRYKETMPRVMESVLVKKEGNVLICRVVIDTPFPLPNLEATTRAVHTVENGRWKRQWKMISGDYKQNKGGWTLSAFGEDQNRTLVVYRSAAVPDMFVPKSLQDWARKREMPGIIKRLRKEVKKLGPAPK